MVKRSSTIPPKNREAVTVHNRLGCDTGTTVLPIMILENYRTALRAMYGKKPAELHDEEVEYQMNPLDNPAYMKELERVYPELAKAHKEYAAQLRKIGGVKDMDELRNVARRVRFAESPTERQWAKETIREIRMRYANAMSICDNYKFDYREEGLLEVSKKANAAIERPLREHVPEIMHEVLPPIEVACIDDPAILLLRSFDQDGSSIPARYAARTKLEFMHLFGGLKDESNTPYELPALDQVLIDDPEYSSVLETPMSRLVSFLERNIFVTDGEKCGTTFSRFLVSHHRKRSFQTTRAHFTDEIPPEGSRQIITPIKLRKAIIRDDREEDGRDSGKKKKPNREIYFYVTSREKDEIDAMHKSIRRNTDPNTPHTDTNGVRFVFANKEDMDDFFELSFEKKIKQEIESDLESMLETETDPENRKAIQRRIDEIDLACLTLNKKDTLQGGTFEGNSPGSSSNLRILKYEYLVQWADESLDEYEFQIFLPADYAEYLYSQSESHAVYRHERARELIMKLLPKSIYPLVTAEKLNDMIGRRLREAFRSVIREERDLSVSINPPARKPSTKTEPDNKKTKGKRKKEKRK